MTFRARRGDEVVLTTYLAAKEAKTNGSSLWDSHARVATSPPPDRIRWRSGFASCCDRSLVAADMVIRARRSGPVRYTVRARQDSGAGASRARDAGGGHWWPLLAAGAGLLALALGARLGPLRPARRGGRGA
jgi:hypothetical protein